MHLWIVQGQAEDVYERYVKLLIVYQPPDNGLERLYCDHPTSGLLL